MPGIEIKFTIYISEQPWVAGYKTKKGAPFGSGLHYDGESRIGFEENVFAGSLTLSMLTA